jgi:hypothetical protein
MTNADKPAVGMDQVQSSILASDPHSLAALLDSGADDEHIWSGDELAAILRHQLSAPIQVDLSGLDTVAAPRVRMLSEAHGLLLKSFGDLLRHPNPPVELLKLTKDFAKAYRVTREGGLPREIATILYFASIVAARLRCRRRISRLDNAALRRGVELCLNQPWLDDSTRQLFEEGLKELRGNGNAAANKPTH